MSEKVLDVKHVYKQYRGYQALNDVTISLEKGKIYGLIGKNGAGKTTMMRLITGLAFPTKGELILFGKKEKKEIENSRSRIGSLIEYPSLNETMTARENLKYYYMLKGKKQDDSAEKLIQLVGLGDTEKKKVKDFSLGMRQRLGIAIALIGEPELIILDEPVNGLDPIGVIEIRELIKKINCEKKITILISSHNLSELYRIATDYIIIEKGSIVRTTTLVELEEQGEDNLEKYFISVIAGAGGVRHE